MVFVEPPLSIEAFDLNKLPPECKVRTDHQIDSDSKAVLDTVSIPAGPKFNHSYSFASLGTYPDPMLYQRGKVHDPTKAAPWRPCLLLEDRLTKAHQEYAAKYPVLLRQYEASEQRLKNEACARKRMRELFQERRDESNVANESSARAGKDENGSFFRWALTGEGTYAPEWKPTHSQLTRAIPRRHPLSLQPLYAENGVDIKHNAYDSDEDLAAADAKPSPPIGIFNKHEVDYWTEQQRIAHRKSLQKARRSPTKKSLDAMETRALGPNWSRRASEAEEALRASNKIGPGRLETLRIVNGKGVQAKKQAKRPKEDNAAENATTPKRRRNFAPATTATAYATPPSSSGDRSSPSKGLQTPSPMQTPTRVSSRARKATKFFDGQTFSSESNRYTLRSSDMVA